MPWFEAFQAGAFTINGFFIRLHGSSKSIFCRLQKLDKEFQQTTCNSDANAITLHVCLTPLIK